MENDIIKILNLKGYDIDLNKSYLDNNDFINVNVHVYLNKRELRCPLCNSKTKLKKYKIKKLTHALFLDTECNLYFHNRRMICNECEKSLWKEIHFLLEVIKLISKLKFQC